MISDGIAGSSRTLSRMAKCLRNVCKNSMDSFIRDKGQRVGGRTEFTVIDESHFRHKRKYGRGRAGQTWRRKKWVFGILGVRGQTRRPVLRLVEHRSRRALLPLVRRHVRQGSTIISDEWRAYRGALSDMGYIHLTVNHSRNFVNSHTGAHTQHLERAWSSYKGHVWRLRGNRTESILIEHLKLIEWTYWLGKCHRDGPLGRLLKDIRKLFSV
ncbi:hypothetical protein SRHO_G00081570 [Serrasalmus rhombeus]|nr:uncharacterized protein LOC119261624 [Pygocentrus nattereri]